MGKNTKKALEPKPREVYKLSNWSAYNKSLKNRGSLQVWLSEDIDQWWYYTKAQLPGGERIYSDRAIELCLTIKYLFGLAYRQTEGFLTSLVALSGLEIEIPSYSQIQRRSKSISVNIKVRKQSKGPIDLVIDSTGLKVYGEGEWKVRKHGWNKYRTWRKLHIASDGIDLEIISLALTTNQNDDAEGGREVIKQIKEPIACVVGDGAYDKRTFRGCLPRGIPQIIPPRRDARDLKGKVPEYDQRDQVVRRIKNTSRTEWKKEVGYHIRSKSEVNMYRYKVTFGERMSSRKLAFEKTEVLIKAKILNQFVSLGMPKSYKVA